MAVMLSPRYTEEGHRVVLPELQDRMGRLYAEAYSEFSLPRLKSFYLPETVITFHDLSRNAKGEFQDTVTLLYAGVNPLDHYKDAIPLEKAFWKVRTRLTKDGPKSCTRLVHGVKEMEPKEGRAQAMIILECELLDSEGASRERKAELCRCIHQGVWLIEEVWTFDAADDPPRQLPFLGDFATALPVP
mmetsp:Transcript_105484/g.340208  ORF Transcript_105484/g.340208 Transcript_105484/m.340208 type:complete len:188 (+) Transcript_105484:136-699(+)